MKRVRATHRKARSGCRTCKIRRIKCDEAKPACKQCQSSGRVCDGYGIWSENAGGRYNCVTPVAVQDARGLRTSMFASTNEELRCLHYFRERTSKKIPSVFFSHFWHRTVLQGSEADVAVRHAAIALSAAHQSADLNLRGSRIHCCEQMDRDEVFALQHYTSAVTHLRQKDPASQDIRLILAACLLFITLDLLRGEYIPATTHIKHGSSIVASIRDQGRYKAETWMASLDEAFDRLHTQRILFDDSHASRAQLRPIQLPLTFETMTAARASLDKLLQSIAYLCKSARSSHEAGETVTSAANIDAQTRLSSALQSWSRAYAQSTPKLLHSSTNHTRLSIPLLRIYRTMATIMTATALSPSQQAFTRHTAAFTSILTQTITLLHTASQTAHFPLSPTKPLTGLAFTTDMGLIPPLQYTALKCRVPPLRRHAIALLEFAPHREGMWDSLVVAQLARRVVALEEEDDDEDGEASLHQAQRRHVHLLTKTVTDHPPPLESSPFLSAPPSQQQLLLPLERNLFRHVEMRPRGRAKVRLVCWRHQAAEPGASPPTNSRHVEDFDFGALDRGCSTGVDFQ